jgi:hypothetical protein
VFFLALIVGFAISIPAWYVASRYAATFILAMDQRRNEAENGKGLRAGEAVLCGALFLGCVGLAVWIATALTR